MDTAMKKWVYTASLMLLLAACASGPTIVTNTNPRADFGSFKTWNFLPQLGTDRDNGARTPMSTLLMNAMVREMESRGLSQSDSPDLLVDFNVWAEDRVDIRSTPSHTIHRSHWHRGFSTWPTYETRIRQYTEGSMLLDLIDPASGVLVAEAVASQRIRDTSFTQEQADKLVAELMSSVWAN
jgi:hypothetical protein